MNNTAILLLSIPIGIVQLVLMVINLFNVTRKDKTRYLNKVFWLFIIILGGLVGNIVYLILENIHDDSN